jgi:hypothetical protein
LALIGHADRKNNPDIHKFSVSSQLVGLDFYRFSVLRVTVLRPFRQLVHGNLENREWLAQIIQRTPGIMAAWLPLSGDAVVFNFWRV